MECETTNHFANERFIVHPKTPPGELCFKELTNKVSYSRRRITFLLEYSCHVKIAHCFISWFSTDVLEAVVVFREAYASG